MMTAKTCIGTYLFALQHNFIDLIEMAFNYIAQNIMDIDPIDFNVLSFEQFSNILKRNDLNVDTEKKMFELLLSWLHYEIDNRKEFFPKLLSLIKLALLEAQVSIFDKRSIHKSLRFTLNHFSFWKSAWEHFWNFLNVKIR